jgi:hypothetical protein
MAEEYIETPLDKLKIVHIKEEQQLIDDTEEEVKAREQRIYEQRVAQAAHAREARKRKREQAQETIENDTPIPVEVDPAITTPSDLVEPLEEIEVPDTKRIHPNPDNEVATISITDELQLLKSELGRMKAAMVDTSNEMEEVRKLRQQLKRPLPPAQPVTYWKTMPAYSHW